MSEQVAVIGGGSVGSALARGLAAQDRAVRVGVRAPDDTKYAELRAVVPVVPIDEVAVGAAAVILAVPAAAVGAVLGGLRLDTGQVLIDATNAVGQPVPEGFETMGDYVCSLVGDVPVAKAFNTIGAEHLGDGRFEEGGAFLPVAGDEAARAVAIELADSLGFETADLGGREAFAMSEAHARLWIHLAFRCGWGREFGFQVVGR
ncbi:MAG: NAD(P)-binding domain-containing protein [Actinomycetota bacterium]